MREQKTYQTPPDTDWPEVTPRQIIGQDWEMLRNHVTAWAAGRQEDLPARDRALAAKIIENLNRHAWHIRGVDENGEIRFGRRWRSVMHQQMRAITHRASSPSLDEKPTPEEWDEFQAILRRIEAGGVNGKEAQQKVQDLIHHRGEYAKFAENTRPTETKMHDATGAYGQPDVVREQPTA